MVLRRENPLLEALEGVGPGNLDFFGPKWHSLCLKKSRLQGPPLPMPLVMDLARLKTITYRAL